jgi:hypothetical protein
MAAPFRCECGAASCRGDIQGFKHLNPAAQAVRPGIIHLGEKRVSVYEEAPGFRPGPRIIYAVRSGSIHLTLVWMAITYFVNMVKNTKWRG